jgi:hypothetical protein
VLFTPTTPHNEGRSGGPGGSQYTCSLIRHRAVTRDTVHEERPSTNWGRVLFWIGVVILALLVLTYVVSLTLQPS